MVYIQYMVTLAKIRVLSYGYHTDILWLSYGKGSSCVRLWALSGCTRDALWIYFAWMLYAYVILYESTTRGICRK